VLDVGCGDGRVSRLIADRRPDICIRGVDVFLRHDVAISASPFDGARIPFNNASFDVVMFVDVLHHTEDPRILLREAVRVARQGILIKDHVLRGLLAGPTLRFMDWVGNKRHGVALPFNYWSELQWKQALGDLGLQTELWEHRLRLYPVPARWIFERGLHFIGVFRSRRRIGCSATESPAQMSKPASVHPWEEAYLRFETPEQEIRKFIGRLKKVGAHRWPKQWEILELFCGRGNGLRALRQFGFRSVSGVDLSPYLASQYSGQEQILVADCRNLPFVDESKDVLIVQGGLHHLLSLPSDLERTVREAKRVLRKRGLFFAVEPWLTLFLRVVHAGCRSRFLRMTSDKVDALATMINHERKTYQQWLRQPNPTLEIFHRHFVREECFIRWGKIYFLGRKESAFRVSK
jgi:SAM-dependent methyltransferase